MSRPHLQLYTRPKYYAGPDYFDYYPILGQHRDSDTIERSNYTVAKQRLETLIEENAPNDEGEMLLDIRDRHWAVGWVETLYLHKDAPEKVLDEANDLLESIEDYPVLDDDHHSELESDEHYEWLSSELRGDEKLIEKYFELNPEYEYQSLNFDIINRILEEDDA